jgi:ABC-2 type transport system ATP-binding protein
MIDVEHLVFEYPGIYALNDVSLSIRRGDVTALVGPNGAGKTTLMRCLAALDQPISGAIRIAGVDVLAHPRETHRKVGYVPDFFGLFPELTVWQSLHYYARAHGVTGDGVEPAIRKAAGRLQLLDRMEQKTRTLSRGLSQRVAVAQAIVHEPEVLLLDEPASGLDPEARKHLADLFLELQANGMTLIVSSHILAELEAYATSMVIMREGRVVEHTRLGQRPEALVTLSLTLSREAVDLLETLRAQAGVQHVKGSTMSAAFQYSADKGAQAALLRDLIDHGLSVCSFGEEKTNLQDAYLQSMRSLGEDAPA